MILFRGSSCFSRFGLARLLFAAIATTVPCFVVESFTPHQLVPKSIRTSHNVPLYMTFEVMQGGPVDNLLTSMDTFWQTSPYTAAALVCGFKASAADAIAQQSSTTSSEEDEIETLEPPSKEQERPLQFKLHSNSATATAALSTTSTERMMDNLDVKRNLAFILYGAFYQGMVHEYVFNTLYPAWFGSGTEVSIVMIKVAFNLFVQTTLVTLPVAYILKAVIMNDEDNDPNHDCYNPLQTALDKYWQDIHHQNLLGKCFALWGPVQCLTFSVVPEHYRVTFIAIVSFFWLIMLSNISSNDNNHQNADLTLHSRGDEGHNSVLDAITAIMED